jgi:aspartate-semialdehyde dehydrogenase
MKKMPILALVGATGLVGTTMLKVLEERDFPFENLYLMASAKSAGKTVIFKRENYIVEELTEHSFDKPIDIALFSAGGATSEKYAPIAASKGVTVVDNSSAWRMDPKVPLVVPEVNPQDIQWNQGIIANPNCSTIQAVLPLKPLHDKYRIKRVIYSTYQAVSGSGVKGIEDLKQGLAGNDIMKAYPHPIAGNCLPHIDSFLENGYTKEEMKMVNETKKILGDDSIRITATTVRVPIFDCHGESINVELEKPFELEEVKDLHDLNSQALEWCRKVDSKVHGTTGEIPLEALNKEPLLPLPDKAIRDKYRWETRNVTRDGFVSYDGAKYGIPWQYSGKEVRVRICGDFFEAYYGEVRIARHKVEYASGKIVWLKGQYQGLAEKGGIALPLPFARKERTEAVEIRPLSVYDALAGVISNV